MTQFAIECLKISDPVVFARDTLSNWFGGVPDETQSTILRSDARQIVCNSHRQWGKSYTIAVKALHRAVYFPHSEILIASATQKQSEEMFKKISDASRYIDGLNRIGDSRTKMGLRNGSRIITLSGSESSVRGYTAPDLVIIDEASWADEGLYVAIRPMMLNSTGQLVLISTPHGKQGFFYDVWSHHGEVDPNGDDMLDLEDGWERYRVRATENKRVTKEWLDRERGEMTERMFRQEYGCEFVETEEQVFSYDLIKSMFSDDVDPMFDSIVRDDIEPMDFTNG